MDMTNLCKFHPIHSSSTAMASKSSTRTRSPFNDPRRAARVDIVIDQLRRHGTTTVHQLSTYRKDCVAAYRICGNKHVDPCELIRYCCSLDEAKLEGQDILVLGDGSSVNLGLSGHGTRQSWADQHSCLVNSKVPGFQFMAGLVINETTHHIIGLSDIVYYDSPRDHRPSEERHRERSHRLKLPLQQRESGCWTILADNSTKALSAAKRVTFVYDREADSMETMAHLMQQTCVDFIIRCKYNRQVSIEGTNEYAKLNDALAGVEWKGRRKFKIRGLNHYSHTKGKKRKRKARAAKLKIRYARLKPMPNKDYSKYHAERPAVKSALTLVEVYEDASTVPAGEGPIHWQLWTTWPINSLDAAWEVVKAYRGRWNVEQLFRLLKSDGMTIEKSQLRHPDHIKRLLIMAIKASADALRLVQVREGETLVGIEEMFDHRQQLLLSKLNESLSDPRTVVINPHASNNLAFAAWIIARLGGWKGYASQRPPGPITMHRGLEKFHDAFEIFNLITPL
ncbi:MAG: IS4 family transposase [Bacteroidota bacterium]